MKSNTHARTDGGAGMLADRFFGVVPSLVHWMYQHLHTLSDLSASGTIDLRHHLLLPYAAQAGARLTKDVMLCRPCFTWSMLASPVPVG